MDTTIGEISFTNLYLEYIKFPPKKSFKDQKAVVEIFLITLDNKHFAVKWLKWKI